MESREGDNIDNIRNRQSFRSVGVTLMLLARYLKILRMPARRTA